MEGQETIDPERDELRKEAEETAKEAQHPEQDVMCMLLKLPNDIKALELDLLERRSREDVLENMKGRIESETMGNVADEMLQDGKPRYSNDMKRQAEATLRNNMNAAHKNFSEELLTSRNASKKVEIGLRWRLHQLSAYKKIAELMAARGR